MDAVNCGYLNTSYGEKHYHSIKMIIEIFESNIFQITNRKAIHEPIELSFMFISIMKI